MKDCRTIYLANEAVMRLEDTKRTSENDDEMFVKLASLIRMKSCSVPCSVPRVNSWKNPYSSGRHCKENAALRYTEFNFLPIQNLAGRRSKREAKSERVKKWARVTSCSGAPATFSAKQLPLPLQASLALLFLVSDVLPRTWNNH